MDEKAANSENFGSGANPEHSIAKHGGPDPPALPVAIHRQPSQNRHWNRIRHVPLQRTRSIDGRQGAGRDSAVSNDPTSLSGDHVGS